MNYQNFIVKEKFLTADNTTIFNVVPKEGKTLFPFKPGQYCQIINPKYDLTDGRYFSISSTPFNTDHFQFSIKTYGNWTKAISKLKSGDSLMINGPFGQFTWDDKLSDIVFLVGGLGIAPIMSMLRTAAKLNSSANVTLIYGNKTPETTVFKEELKTLQTKLSNFNVIHIFSEVDKNHPWKGHRGFISGDIIQKETSTQKATFFIIGPPIFMQKMEAALANLQVKSSNIRKELIS